MTFVGTLQSAAGGAVLAGTLSTHLGVRTALLCMTALTVPAVALAWTSPLRGYAGEPAGSGSLGSAAPPPEELL
jgi:predicted MFS family arabinose efflux permease